MIALRREYPVLARFGVRDYGLQLAEAGDPLGLEMQDTLLRNELLTNELVLREFIHFLDRVPAEVTSVTVEGYPRDLLQCEDLLSAVEARGDRLAAFVVVEVPDEVVRARVADRRICFQCGLPVEEVVAVTCPDCDGAVIRRSDDDAAKLARRLRDYRRLGEEVRAYFAEHGLLRIVDGLRSPAEVRRDLAALLLDEESDVRI